MTRDEARQRVRELADHLEHRGRKQDERGIIHAEGNLKDAEALRLLLSPPTCATCQWWEELQNANGIGLGDGRCFKGVRVGRPTRQNLDGGLYTAKDFGCTLHESRTEQGEK